MHKETKVCTEKHEDTARRWYELFEDAVKVVGTFTLMFLFSVKILTRFLDHKQKFDSMGPIWDLKLTQRYLYGFELTYLLLVSEILLLPHRPVQINYFIQHITVLITRKKTLFYRKRPFELTSVAKNPKSERCIL